jgi:hypothetical protein
MTMDQRVVDYPLFSPPADLAEKPRADWTNAEARRYFDWLMSEIPERVATLASFLELDLTRPPEEVLAAAGEQLVQLLPLTGVSTSGRTERSTLLGHNVETETGPLVTVIGYSFAADLGLVLATFLQAECPDLRWEVITRPKSDVAYQLPALKPFGPVHMDPIQVSVNVAHRVLAGGQTPVAWRDVYLWWRGRCGAG